MRTQHLVITEKGALFCQHCGGAGITELPASISKVVNQAKWFMKLHANCQALEPGDVVGFVTKGEDDPFCVPCASAASILEGYSLEKEIGPGGMLETVLRRTAAEHAITCTECSRTLALVKGY